MATHHHGVCNGKMIWCIFGVMWKFRLHKYLLNPGKQIHQRVEIAIKNNLVLILRRIVLSYDKTGYLQPFQTGNNIPHGFINMLPEFSVILLNGTVNPVNLEAYKAHHSNRHQNNDKPYGTFSHIVKLRMGRIGDSDLTFFNREIMVCKNEF